MGFRIGLLYTRFASMPQALWAALREDGHEVIRPEDLHIRTPMAAEDMIRFARLAAPDVILCPFLKEIVPSEVCERTTTWVPHPGIRGDRGPSSLSWAVLEGEPRWGLTMVRAEPTTRPEELDGGNIGAWREFAMPTEATMGEVYAQLVIPAAIDCAREVLARMAVDPAYSGVPLASFGSAAVGRHRPALRQDRLAFAWDDHPDQILRHIRAAPFGVQTELGSQLVNVYDAHPHDVQDGWSRPLRTRADRPGQILAHRDSAVLVATGAGGAVLSACFEVVLARPSINLNYHYGAMGLSGSELRSLVLPLRAGEQAAERLLTDRLPVSPMAAQRLGLVDGVGPDDPVAFDRWARQVATQVADRPSKAPPPSVDPRPYRQRELVEMWHDIFEDRHGFEANRRRFLGLAA
jgi:methionyl-tRNA formyltransferase